MSDGRKASSERHGPFNIVNRVIWSWHGWLDAWRNEPSFRSWVYANIASDALAFVLPIDPSLRAMIVVLGVVVLAVELINTGVERLADLVEPNENAMIKACKDATSG